MAKQNVGIYIFGGVVVLGLAYFGYEAYSANVAKKTVTPPADTPGQTAVSVDLLAAQIYQDLSGINLFANHNEDIYNNALALSNTDFVNLYNSWQTNYFSQYGKSLTGAISEHGALPLTPWSTVKTGMINKLNSLNLQ